MKMRIRPGSFHVFIPIEVILPKAPDISVTSSSKLFAKPKRKPSESFKNWLKNPKMPSRPSMTYGGFVALLVMSCVMHISTFFEHYAIRTVLTGWGLTFLTTMTESSAQNTQQESPKPNAPQPNAPQPQASTTQNAGQNTNSSQPTEGITPADQNTKAPEEKNDAMFDLMGLTESQLKVLLSLNKRLKDIESREQQIQDKETLLKAFEKEVQERQTQLKALKQTIEEVAKTNNDDVMKNMQHMVAVYEAMKPDVAAKIFNELPKPVLVALIKQMKPKKASAVLSLMQVEIAKAITDHFAFSPYIPDEKDPKKG